MLRQATGDEKPKQGIDDILIINPAGYQYSQTFASIFIDDIQYFKGSTVSRAAYHEVIAPDMILTYRLTPMAGIGSCA